MTVIDWLVTADKSLLPIYAAVIIIAGLYGYLKPNKEEKQETSYVEPQKINPAYDGNIPQSTWSLRETYFIPTINDCLQSLPPIEECAVAGTYRGHRVFRVNSIFDSISFVRDGDYIICQDSLYLSKNNELILIKYEN